MEEEENEQVDLQKVVTGAIVKSVMGTAVVFVGLLAAAYFMGFIGSTQPVSADGAVEGGDSEISWKDGAVLDGGSFVVNLADKGTPRYAKVSYGIVLAEGVDPEVAEERLPIMKDRIMPFLMEKTSEELSSGAGFEMVRKRLTEDAQSTFQGRALRALVTELIVQ
jgi:flagellar basal body-associated protein FliL